MKLSFERGNFSRVVLGIIICALFLISALTETGDHRGSLFMVGIGIILTWQQYSLYRMKQREDRIRNAEGQDSETN